MMFRVPLIAATAALVVVGCAPKAETVEPLTQLPRMITLPNGERVSDGEACTRAGGEWLLSDPTQCTAPIRVMPGTFQPPREEPS